MEDKLRHSASDSLRGTVAGRVIEATGARHVGQGRWRANCPVCGGKNGQKFVMTVVAGRILIHCFAGCELAELLKALEMSSASELWDDPSRRPEVDPELDRLRRERETEVMALAVELRTRDIIIRHIDNAVHSGQLSEDVAMDLLADQFLNYSELEFKFETLRTSKEHEEQHG